MVFILPEELEVEAEEEVDRTAIFRMSYQEESCTVVLCNHGCNWDCSICSYKLRGDIQPSRFLSMNMIINGLSSARVERVILMGGEPLTCEDLDTIVVFVKEELGAIVKIAHSNASLLPPEGIDEMGVSLHAITKRKHQQLTGAPNNKVLANIYKLYDRGIKIKISTILIPEVIALDEIKRISEYVASVDESIHFHITGYIPVPGLPWMSPSMEEMKAAVKEACRHLKNVTSSSLTLKDYLAMTEEDSLHSK
jgi:pyruvate formate lyase activating enzyme